MSGLEENIFETAPKIQLNVSIERAIIDELGAVADDCHTTKTGLARAFIILGIDLYKRGIRTKTEINELIEARNTRRKNG